MLTGEVGNWGGRGAESYHRENVCSSKNHSILAIVFFHLETAQMAGSGRPGCLAVNRTCENIMLVFLKQNLALGYLDTTK
jgi:hypothetical protein